MFNTKIIKETCLVSIIIPTYNNSETIVVALQSVFNQTFKSFEVILVNDGSNDITDLKIEKFKNSISAEDKRKLFYFKKQNSGPSDTRNLGISKAKGQFIAFLDADDSWYHNKLQLQIDYFNKFPNVVMVSTALGNKKLNKSIEYKFISFKRLLWNNFFYTSTVIVRKESLGEFRFNANQRFSEDYRLWLEICSTGPCMYVNNILVKNQFNKLSFGDSGLSSNLIGMTLGELSNFLYLFKSKKIGFFTFVLVSFYSSIKYFRRCIITQFLSLKKSYFKA